MPSSRTPGVIPDGTYWYAIIISDDSTPDDPDGILRVVVEDAEIRAEFWDYDDKEWVEDNSQLDRVFEPDGSRVEITRADAEKIAEHDGFGDKIDAPAESIMDYSPPRS